MPGPESSTANTTHSPCRLALTTTRDPLSFAQLSAAFKQRFTKNLAQAAFVAKRTIGNWGLDGDIKWRQREKDLIGVNKSHSGLDNTAQIDGG